MPITEDCRWSVCQLFDLMPNYTPFNGSIEVDITAEDLQNNDPGILLNLVPLGIVCCYNIIVVGLIHEKFSHKMLLSMNKLSAAQCWWYAAFGGGDFFQSPCANSPQVASVLHTKSCTGDAFPSIL